MIFLSVSLIVYSLFKEMTMRFHVCGTFETVLDGHCLKKIGNQNKKEDLTEKIKHMFHGPLKLVS